MPEMFMSEVTIAKMVLMSSHMFGQVQTAKNGITMDQAKTAINFQILDQEIMTATGYQIIWTVMMMVMGTLTIMTQASMASKGQYTT